ncbi:MAG TPA: hypothetical protein VNW97_16740 [Candidatus Saccharimonadales bacterium]|jgi:hypothetical protein|nr:hypothetical protein [Candidatus Saccharimonadales bacterium]
MTETTEEPPMSTTIQAYDDAFRIIQQTILRHDSITGISFLTRVESYLVQQGRRELHDLLSN